MQPESSLGTMNLRLGGFRSKIDWRVSGTRIENEFFFDLLSEIREQHLDGDVGVVAGDAALVHRTCLRFHGVAQVAIKAP